MKLLGDRIKTLTSAVGIKPCSNCQKRALHMNELDRNFRDRRRNFIKGVTVSAFMLRNSMLKAMWQITGQEAPEPVVWARAILAQFQTNMEMFRKKDGHYPSPDVVWGYIIGKIEKSKDKPPFKIDPHAKEIIPGWTFDFAEKPKGYVIVFKGPVYTLISGQSKDTPIFQLSTQPNQPKASEVPSALDYPGVRDAYPEHISSMIREGLLTEEDIPPKLKRKSLTAWQRITNWFIPSVYAFHCGTCSPVQGCDSCDCSACEPFCCGGAWAYCSCHSFALPDDFFGCEAYIGCPAQCFGNGCTWLWGPCGPPPEFGGYDCECSCCVKKVLGYGSCSSHNCSTAGYQDCCDVACANIPSDCGNCWNSTGSCSSVT